MRDIKVSWPLHLVGGGNASDETVLECPESISGALIFRCATHPALTLHTAEAEKGRLCACGPVLLSAPLCAVLLPAGRLFGLTAAGMGEAGLCESSGMCRASGKLANLTICSTAAACITHLQGHLTVDVGSSHSTPCSP